MLCLTLSGVLADKDRLTGKSTHVYLIQVLREVVRKRR